MERPDLLPSLRFVDTDCSFKTCSSRRGLARFAKIVSDAGLAMVDRDGMEWDEAWNEDEDDWWRHSGRTMGWAERKGQVWTVKVTTRELKMARRKMEAV